MALSQTRINALLSPYYPGEGGRVLIEAINSAHADIIALKAWGDALAAKLNAEAAGGVATFDTNYAGPTITTTGI